ncbi:phospholipase/carboxylesterase family protein [Xylariaceae sp. FL1272]|nr:phospholipase/carboxylesterase family protein [Xylariaceae sp. FL1272]
MNKGILTVGPAPSNNHTHTVIFLHGRGDNAQNFTRALGYWRDSQNRTLADVFPTFRWVFPQSPMRKCASGPETWPQWFDVWNTRDFAEREELQQPGLREVVPALRKLIADEATLLGGRWDRVVLMGISMGAATAVHTLFNLHEPLAALVCFCARCPFAGRTLHEMRGVLALDDAPEHDRALRGTPVLLEHCADDPLVLKKNGEGLRATLRGFGADVEWREYPDGGHWLNSPAGADDAVRFLQLRVWDRYTAASNGEGTG